MSLTNIIRSASFTSLKIAASSVAGVAVGLAGSHVIPSTIRLHSEHASDYPDSFSEKLPRITYDCIMSTSLMFWTIGIGVAATKNLSDGLDYSSLEFGSAVYVISNLASAAYESYRSQNKNNL